MSKTGAFALGFTVCMGLIAVFATIVWAIANALIFFGMARDTAGLLAAFATPMAIIAGIAFARDVGE